MILYHGSNVEVREPVLTLSRRSLDFGAGFYLTSDMEQAGKWARRVARLRASGSPVISVFETDDDIWSSLRFLRFETSNEEWLDAVVGYRSGIKDSNGYDVIFGPVADDRTIDVVNQYMAGAYPKEIAIQLLLPMKLKDQWTIKTERAICALKWKERIVL